MSRIGRVFPAVVLAVVAANAYADDTWLLPESFRAKPGASLRVAATSGMEFPKHDSPIAAERIAIFRVRLAREVSEQKVQQVPAAIRDPAERSRAADELVDMVRAHRE